MMTEVKKQHLTKEQSQLRDMWMAELYVQGLNQKQIAIIFDTAPSVVSYALQRQKIRTRRGNWVKQAN